MGAAELLLQEVGEVEEAHPLQGLVRVVLVAQRGVQSLATRVPARPLVQLQTVQPLVLPIIVLHLARVFPVPVLAQDFPALAARMVPRATAQVQEAALTANAQEILAAVVPMARAVAVAQQVREAAVNVQVAIAQAVVPIPKQSAAASLNSIPPIQTHWP